MMSAGKVPFLRYLKLNSHVAVFAAYFKALFLTGNAERAVEAVPYAAMKSKLRLLVCIAPYLSQKCMI